MSIKGIAESVILDIIDHAIDDLFPSDDEGSTAAETAPGQDNDDDDFDPFSTKLTNLQDIEHDYEKPNILNSEQVNISYTDIRGFEFMGTSHNYIWEYNYTVACYLDRNRGRLFCIYRSYNKEQTKLVQYWILHVINVCMVAYIMLLLQFRDGVTVFIVTFHLLILVLSIIEICAIKLAFLYILEKFTESIKQGNTSQQSFLSKPIIFAWELKLIL